MIFIFDWGHTTVQRIGPVEAHIAGQNESEEGYVWLYRATAWFRAFFIKLIPTGRRYYLGWRNHTFICEINRAEYERLQPLATLNQAAADGTIDEKAYQTRRAALRL
jgi:hypothetical protein